MSVNNPDSTDKIMGYIDKMSAPKVTISPKLLRGYVCKPGCGGCCQKFTLDYLDGSRRLANIRKLYPEAAARLTKRKVGSATVWSDLQGDNKTRWCRHLDREGGLCGIHKANPFSCAFELVKVTKTKDTASLITKLFSRGWKMLRIDGGKGALCELRSMNADDFEEIVGLLVELEAWATAMRKPKGALPRAISFLRSNSSKILSGRRMKTAVVLRSITPRRKR